MTNPTSEYNQQKGINPPYVTDITIKDVRTKDIEKGTIYQITATDGQFYSHFKSEKYRGWENYLKAGYSIQVFVRPKQLGDKVFLNVYPSAAEPYPYDENGQKIT